MLTIRLQRAGRKNQPIFRIVLAEKHKAAQKKFVEQLGTYNPRSKEFAVKEDRLKYWVEKHVQMSPTAHNLFVTKKLIEAKKVHAWQPRRKPEAAKAAEIPAQAGTQTPAAPVAEATPTPAAGGVGAPTENVGTETPTTAEATADKPAA